MSRDDRADPLLPADVPQLVDHLFRHQAGRVVSTLTRIFGPRHLQMAEDVVQETLLKALHQWPYRGIPADPAAWIMQVARNHTLDLLRRERGMRDRQAALGQLLEQPDRTATDPDILDSLIWDDQLRMIFVCCHPVLSRDAQVALTLKTVGGFGVPEIARAFLVPESTIAQRLVRAKRTIRTQRIAFDVPAAAYLPERLDSVLSVLYCLFNAGYDAHHGEDLIRLDLCAEAIRLTSLLADHSAGDQPPVHALLSLMLLLAARLPARTTLEGDLLLLEEQDRGLWDRSMVAAGLQRLDRSARGSEPTIYHLQAGIAALHALAPSYQETDWRQILDHYNALMSRTTSPVIALNRAVAVAAVNGPQAGLDALEEITEPAAMQSYYLLHATHGKLYRDTGDLTRAAASYRQALLLTANDAERRFLQRRLNECVSTSAGI